MYLDYTPWWDAKIGIDFTRHEWELILHELRQLYYIPEFPETHEDKILVNIIDRIEKTLGVE